MLILDVDFLPSAASLPALRPFAHRLLRPSPASGAGAGLRRVFVVPAFEETDAAAAAAAAADSAASPPVSAAMARLDVAAGRPVTMLGAGIWSAASGERAPAAVARAGAEKEVLAELWREVARRSPA